MPFLSAAIATTPGMDLLSTAVRRAASMVGVGAARAFAGRAEAAIAMAAWRRVILVMRGPVSARVARHVGEIRGRRGIRGRNGEENKAGAAKGGGTPIRAGT